MSKYIFKKEPTTPVMGFNHDTTTVTLETENVSLDALLEEFTAFLRACGFSPKGELAFVEEETNETEEK